MGLLDDVFDSETEMLDTRNPQSQGADQWLLSLLQSGTPTIPGEQIAGMSDAEKMAQQLVMQYGTSTPEGMDTIRSMATASDNILEDPTIAALMSSIENKGNLSANRLSRSLMLRGGGGGAGADMLGRSVTDTQKEMLSTLAPYAEAAKGRKLSAAQILSDLGETSTLNRLNALSGVGSLPRTLEQLQKSADYQRALTEVMFPYQQGANVAATLSGSQPMTVQQTPSIFSQYAPILAQGVQVAAATMGGGAGGGAGSGTASSSKGVIH
jgi:hypothetical protein